MFLYFENINSGKISRIITSSWPKAQIGSFIPEVEYEELDRIEYNENWINIYINNAKKSDAKDYFKKLKKYNFNKNERKKDGEVMLEYKVYYVRIRYFKENNNLEIYAKFLEK